MGRVYSLGAVEETVNHWQPWLMNEDGTRAERLVLDRVYRTKDEITEFFTYMHKTHPRLVGKHIEFEEILDKAP